MSIHCEGCNDWFHPKCQGLSSEAFKAIDLHDLFWVCQTCQKNLKETVSLGKIVAGVEQAEKNIIKSIVRDKSRKIAEQGLEEKLDKMEITLVEELSEQKQVILQSSDKIKKVVQENKEERDMNLIIHNLPESRSPNAEVRKEAQFQAMSMLRKHSCRHKEGLQVG